MTAKIICYPESVGDDKDVVETRIITLDNGTIYIGIVNVDGPESVGYHPLDPNVGDAVGHVMSHSVYKPGETYVYYWGSGWSKGGVVDMKAWTEYLDGFHDALRNPLEIKVK